MSNVEQVDSIEEAMRLAIEHSYHVKGTTYPNPPVGAVILDQDGRVVGVGATAAGRRRPRRGHRAAPGRAVWPPAASRWSPSSRVTTTARLRRA